MTDTMTNNLRSKLISYLKSPPTFVRIIVPLNENSHNNDIFIVTIVGGKKYVDIMICCDLGKTYFVQIVNDNESIMKFPYIYVPENGLDKFLRHIYTVLQTNESKNLCELHNELCEQYNYVDKNGLVVETKSINIIHILSSGDISLIVDDSIMCKLPFKISNHMKKRVIETSAHGTIDKYSDDYTRLSCTIIRGFDPWFDKMMNLIIGSSILINANDMTDAINSIMNMIKYSHIYEGEKPKYMSIRIGQRTYLNNKDGYHEYSIIMPIINSDDVTTVYTHQLE